MSKWVIGLASLVVAATSVGCATYRSVVDTKGVDVLTYETDMKECQAFAEQRDPASQAAAGAAGGAAFGALLGAVLGGSRNRSAGIGAVSGLGAGAGAAMRAQAEIMRNCMAGRGYKVLY